MAKPSKTPTISCHQGQVLPTRASWGALESYYGDSRNGSFMDFSLKSFFYYIPDALVLLQKHRVSRLGVSSLPSFSIFLSSFPSYPFCRFGEDVRRMARSRHSHALSLEPSSSCRGTTSAHQESSCASFTQPQHSTQLYLKLWLFLGPGFRCPL